VPLELEAEPGADDANAYATVEEAEAYAAYRVGSAAFLALTTDQKIQALVTATSDIDTLEADPGFVGDRASDDQALAWPRTGTDDYDDDELPRSLVNATIELAMSYAPAFATGSTIDPLATEAGNGNIKREKVGPLETEYFAAGETGATAFTRFPAVVQRLLFAIVRLPDTSSWGSATVSRGS
jgi:hypothetical protein